MNYCINNSFFNILYLTPSLLLVEIHLGPAKNVVLILHLVGSFLNSGSYLNFNQ